MKPMQQQWLKLHDITNGFSKSGGGFTPSRVEAGTVDFQQ